MSIQVYSEFWIAENKEQQKPENQPIIPTELKKVILISYTDFADMFSMLGCLSYYLQFTAYWGQISDVNNA
jgi:hypothetical protein